MATKKPQVRALLTHRTTKALELLDELRASVEALAATPNPHWGHVGDAGRILEHLHELAICFSLVEDASLIRDVDGTRVVAADLVG